MGNADESRARIYDAALAEFARYGIAGARVDRIAAAAGLNKNLIYIYFGNKEALFQAVISREGDRLQEAAPIRGDDLEGYAADLFDFTEAHPELLRLVLWSTLENGPSPLSERGRASYQRKLDVIAAGQAAGALGQSLSPAALLAVLYALANAWSVANPQGAGVTRLAPITRDEKKAAVITAVKAVLAHMSD
ncbi:TetR/AcrR family transcriptional regulator [Phenylobacterium immobile]|uniref:TetR/AcrR family transcriptional regulator n=1 Tax=Phenylobacterium immobile TaxID=21 RepID=UPI000AF121B9|nr:TetR family transcriptional regulator [Phenylobacterium immobile]